MNTIRHKKRPIRFIRLWEQSGWRAKLYGISEFSEFPDDVFLEAGEKVAEQILPLPAITSQRYGLAFITVHTAKMFNQVIVDWWERENELRHRVFKAEPEAPLDFREITESGEAFCVWELRVISFERDAWVNFVLDGKNGPDIEGYLRQKLNEDC